MVAVGLGEEVDRASLKSGEGDVGPFLRVRADHDHGHVGNGRQQIGKDVDPRLSGHLDIERDHVGMQPLRRFEGFGRVAREADDVQLGSRADQIGNQLAHQRGVVHN